MKENNLIIVLSTFCIIFLISSAFSFDSFIPINNSIMFKAVAQVEDDFSKLENLAKDFQSINEKWNKIFREEQEQSEEGYVPGKIRVPGVEDSIRESQNQQGLRDELIKIEDPLQSSSNFPNPFSQSEGPTDIVPHPFSQSEGPTDIVPNPFTKFEKEQQEQHKQEYLPDNFLDNSDQIDLGDSSSLFSSKTEAEEGEMQQDSNYISELNNKGVDLGNLGKYEEAIVYFDKALQMDPTYVNALNNKALMLGNLGKYEEALQTFNKALEIDPDDVNILIGKGVALGNLGKYEEALQSFNKALEIDPSNSGALNNKAMALEGLGKSEEETIQYYNEALQIAPNDSYVLNNKGVALGNLGKYEEALHYFNKALEIDPNFVAALSNKGTVFFYLNKQQEALHYFNKALEIDPSNSALLNNKGIALSNLGKYEEALQYFNKALEIDPSNINALNNKANNLVRLFEQSNIISPIFSNLKNTNNNYYHYAYMDQKMNVYLNIDNYTVQKVTDSISTVDTASLIEAIQTYDMALSQDPENPTVLINKGIALSKLGSYDESLELFNQALQIEQNNIEAMCNKADVLEKTGKTYEAESVKENIKEVIELINLNTPECNLIDIPTFLESAF